jgi:decaprenylphospho-beta-D-erythro-pentofuranosid-2-ulose 2-reductase
VTVPAPSQRVLILGATSAIAEATARLYAKERAVIQLVGRRADRLREVAEDLRARGAGSVECIRVDLSEGDSAEAWLRDWGRDFEFDVILICQGQLGDQGMAEADLARARELIDLNFTSTAQWILAAAQVLEEQRRGVVAVIGSVAGDRGRQSNYVYGAAKAGLAVLVQGVAHRLSRRGGLARAVLVKPGFVRTPMTAHLDTKGLLWAEPDLIARCIVAAIRKQRPITYAPAYWRVVMIALRLAPASILHRTSL